MEKVINRNLDDNVVIVGRKDIRTYKATLSKASKNNGSVVLASRGNNIQKALSLSAWANKVLGFVVDSTELKQRVFHSDRVVINELKITMKRAIRKNKVFFSLVPVFLFFRLLFFIRVRTARF